MLNKIKKELINEDLVSRVSSNSNYDDIYKDTTIELYDSQGRVISLNDGWDIFEGENLYTQIIQIYSGDKKDIFTKLHLNIETDKLTEKLSEFDSKANKYIDFIIKIKKSKNEIINDIAKLNSNTKFLKENKLPDEQVIEYNFNNKLSKEITKIEQEIETYIEDLKVISESIESLEKISIKYGIKDVIREKTLELKSIFDNSINKLIYLDNIKNTDSKIIKLKNDLLSKLAKNCNKKLGIKINTINDRKQENVNLVEDILERILSNKLLKIQQVVPIISKKDIKDNIELKNTKNARLIINKTILKFEDIETLFPVNINSRKKGNTIKASSFHKIVDLSSQKSVQAVLDVFANNNYLNGIIIDKEYSKFVDFNVELKIGIKEDGKEIYKNIENMSAGELSKIYITTIIDEKVDKASSNLIILFDQPENNLEKRYILKDLVNKFDQLRNKYQIFITTHEPLLVVNADANSIIKADNKKKVNGKNEIVYENLSFIDNPTTKEKMAEKIAELVDGSHDAVKERNRIYGGMTNEN